MTMDVVNVGRSKVTGIRQIVRLKAILQKWQISTLGSKGGNKQKKQSRGGGISPAMSQRMKNADKYCDSDEESCQTHEAPHGVPKGYLAVYVGSELQRFIIPTTYLTNRVFKVLLEKTEEEFGFDLSGGLTFPCDIETFKYLLNYMETHKDEQQDSNGGMEHP
ncbi:auxin-responsive protein SAUR50-like [Impatiens glandulifera]|uniref:auxin-responsive protein SAUR50-like n=1 Tax=Impatiens glandulifera TaxID=253017 RepID=UPI001FB1168E|nr:auxin-responsive protein SAUR50-like [Impatiens glandulifera]